MLGQERDAVFISDRSIVAFEFTTRGDKEKVRKDAEKLRDLLRHLSGQAEHRLKSTQGLVVTMREPSADQRDAVAKVAAAAAMQLQIISYVTLQKSLIDSEAYIALRLQAPFGSASFGTPPQLTGYARGRARADQPNYVEPRFVDVADGRSVGAVRLDELVDALAAGGRLTVSADYGSGKSEALRQAFARLRSRFFKRPDAERIPVHLNLRDFYGLRTPREVLRRHAEEIGFQNEDSLVAAWRSGNCTLLLDGFDELIPARWVGGARDLKQVRWSALEPVRRLIQETPDVSGIVAAGRAQYFNDADELLKSLGLQGGRHFALLDFNTDQASELLGRDAADLPEWLPPRPLLLRFLADNGLLSAAGEPNTERNSAWHAILDLVAEREAQRVGSLTPTTIRTLIARVATTTKASADPNGAVSVTDMRGVFREVCGYEADEEGLQLLLRLPGLASAEGGEAESRRFIDLDLADASYGLDLSGFLMAPYGAHPLAGPVAWTSASGDLSAGVAAVELADRGFGGGSLLGALSKRLDHALFDAVLLDTVRTVDYMGLDSGTELTPFFSELLIRSLDLSGDAKVLATATFSDCVIESVSVDSLTYDVFPKFQNCIIGRVDGWVDMPEILAGNFAGTEIGHFVARLTTTDALVDLDLAVEDRVALLILKKVYLQPGSGRMIAALYRGMPLTDRGAVSPVTAQLVAAGLLGRVTGRGRDLVVPIKAHRKAVTEMLSDPQLFTLSGAVAMVTGQ
ncbi:NTPase [Modestobacter italicus]|uniref:NTPase n=1 Tax=Modestobacter italicus (strain DSM 44449 / CECT 9708 / BC 501) TaxID=2732864 RepID=UPI0014127AED|nr:NTPase [Modestobacter marinus]